MVDMTPIEIFEYKRAWLSAGAFPVRLHSDLDCQGKDWCRKNCQRHQWSFDSYTNAYEHTFWFEHKEHADEFSQQWPEFTNQNG